MIVLSKKENRTAMNVKTVVAALVLLLICAFVFYSCAKFRGVSEKKINKETAFDLVLNTAFLEPGDITIKESTSWDDPFILSSVKHMLKYPVETNVFSEDIVAAQLKNTDTIVGIVKFCGIMLDIANMESASMESINNLSNPECTINIARKKKMSGCLEFAAIENIVYRDFAIGIYEALCYAKMLFDEAFVGLDNDDAGFLQGKIEQLLFYGSYQENISRQESQYLIEKAFAHASAVEIRKIVEAGYVLAHKIDEVVDLLKYTDEYNVDGATLSTPLGDIIIGGSGDDIYNGRMPAILIEAGGNDLYSFDDYSEFSIIVDVSGDDKYESSVGCMLASGVMGIGILVDIKGDDLYQGENYSFGCGFMGIGILADIMGDDTYITQMFGEGAAVLGIGVLHDKKGDDFYQCSLYGQGMGYVGGAGLLIDVQGDDIYAAKNTVPDSREKTGAFQTYAQGFGLGARMFASGGVGILYDGKGSDTYQGSYFCQGASYWHALGMLIDMEGDDRYNARRYSQGAGVHSSIGVLLDVQGDDSYRSWGVSQGCGHDMSVGLLRDCQGDDQYMADWLSQAVGNSMGIGFLIDDRGDDKYIAGKSESIQGAGVYDIRRDALSIGILVDGQGRDNFSGNAEDRRIWSRGSVGGGVDSDGKLFPVWNDPLKNIFFNHNDNSTICRYQKQKPISNEYILSELEVPLYLEDSREKASDLIAKKGPGIIPSLLEYVKIKDVLVQRTIEESLKKLAIEHVADIHAHLLLDETASRNKAFIMYVLGEVKDLASEEMFLKYLKSEDISLRIMAMRGMYKLELPPPVELFNRLAESQDGRLKKYFCLSLKSSDNTKAVQILCDCLSDMDFQVRHAAYGVLKEKKVAESFLIEIKETSGLLPSVYRMVDDLLFRKM